MAYTITISVGCAAAFTAPTFRLPESTQVLHIDFQEGTNVFTSQDIVLGDLTASGEPIVGRFSFRYTYNTEKNRITVCGTDYPSADGMTLVTTAGGETCIEHACQSGFLADEGYHNRVWNYHSQLTQGGPVMKGIVRNANDALITALKGDGHTILVRDIIDLPRDVYLSLCTVQQGNNLTETYDPERTYNRNVLIGNVESQIGGRMHLQPRQDFANVLGSTGDKYPTGYKSFRAVWEAAYGPFPHICTSEGYPPNWYDNKPLVGGHCIEASHAATVAIGADDVAFIIPICNHHNNPTFVDAMKAINTTSGVWLTDYHDP